MENLYLLVNLQLVPKISSHIQNQQEHMDVEEHRERKYRKKQYQFNNRLKDVDEDIRQQLHDKLMEIEERTDINEVEKDRMIVELVDEKNQEKRQKQMHRHKDGALLKVYFSTQQNNPIKICLGFKIYVCQPKPTTTIEEQRPLVQEEEGEIKDRNEDKHQPEPQISYTGLKEHVNSLVLTRNKLEDMLNLLRFEELIKGCYVRYMMAGESKNYTIAQILGIVEKNKYTLGKVQTNIHLKVQYSSSDTQELPMCNVSNQQPPTGSLEINRWIELNNNKIPKIQDLKRKKEMLQKGLTMEISNQEIKSKFLEKIDKVIKKPKENREDVSEYLRFLRDQMHHLVVAIEDSEYNLNPSARDDSMPFNRYRRAAPASKDSDAKKKPTVDIDHLRQERNRIQDYINKIQEIKKEQMEKMQDKKQKQMNKGKILTNFQFEAAKRPDRIAALIQDRMRGLSNSTQVKEMQRKIIEEHTTHDLQIEL